MTERPDSESPSPEEPTRVQDGDSVGARAAGSGWAAAEDTASLADAPTAGAVGGEATAPISPGIEDEPAPVATPVLEPTGDPGPAPTFAGPRPDDEPFATPSVTPHTGATAPKGDLASERPEVVVGGAFAGGLLLGLILKRLGH